ncbi:MAG: FIST N-terminal domain-containing protein [Thiogranum sp.]|nr:FIST N-terminal domain-containing protein [Thiogranum sp.]
MNRPTDFVLGHAQSKHWNSAVADCLQQMGDVPAQANLGFLYVTDIFADLLQNILTRLRSETGVEHWVGTVGIGICAGDREYQQAPAIAVMIGAFPDDSFRMLSFYNRAADNLPASWEDWLTGSASQLAVLHGDPGNSNLPQLLVKLHNELPNARLVGGLTSSHGRHPQVADQLLEGGLSGVVFNDKAPVATALTQGCSPIAASHTITGCDGNVIETLDERPALDVFNEDIGEILARDLNRAAGYIFAGLPIAGSDTRDYLVRNVSGVDTQGRRIAIAEMLHPGQQIQFCRRDAETARQDMQSMLDSLKKRLPGTPRAGLYFTCLGRGEALFGEASGELKMIRESLGDFPLIGFQANGEISGQRLYGYTGVLTLFT